MNEDWRNELITKGVAIDALNGIINRFEQILRDIRESKVDDSVCGMCEYDGAYMGQSGDWCNECPGFDKDDCFKLSDECRKRWLKSVDLPPAQPEKRTNKRTETHACDLISRQAAIDAIENIDWYHQNANKDMVSGANPDRHQAWYKAEDIYRALESVPPAQPEQGKRCVMERKIIYLDDAIDALRYAQHRFTVADEAGGMGTVKWSEDVIYFAAAERVLAELPSAQPETAKRIVGKSRDGMTLWYQCDMCNEPVDEQDNYCRGCGRRLIDG